MDKQKNIKENNVAFDFLCRKNSELKGVDITNCINVK
jgi:hypothetical protein